MYANGGWMKCFIDSTSIMWTTLDIFGIIPTTEESQDSGQCVSLDVKQKKKCINIHNPIEKNIF